jgi:hypothetical protein
VGTHIDEGSGDKVAVQEHVHVAGEQDVLARVVVDDAGLEVGMCRQLGDDLVRILGLQLDDSNRDLVHNIPYPMLMKIIIYR